MFLPKRLVFCGGGTRCLMFAQALVELEKRNRLVAVQDYWGTSAGALVAALLAISKSPSRVKDVMFQANYMNWRNFDVANLLNITSTWGLDDGKSLTDEIESVFETLQPGSKTKKLAEITGLNIVVSDLNSHETVVVNSETYPELRVVDAIRASMSLPLFFRPFRHPTTGHIWVDGAIRAHFPWEALPDDKSRSEALGFTFEKSWADGPQTFMEYLFSMIHFDEPRKIQDLRVNWSRNIVWFPPPPYPAWYVRLKPEDFTLIEQIGRDAADRWLRLGDDSTLSQGMTGNQPSNARRHTPSPSSHQAHTTGTSDTPVHRQPSPPQDSLPHPTPNIPRAVRRWSV
jgi:predicted acylesterase/phospholipase RssA